MNSYYAEPLAALAGVVCMNAVRFPTFIDKTLKILLIGVGYKKFLTHQKNKFSQILER